MSVCNVSSKDEFDKVILESEIPVFAKFFATWCGPCEMAAPVVKELSLKYEKKVKFIQIDIDTNSCRDIVEQYSISSVPTFVVLKNGKEFNRLTGFVSRTHLEDFIQSSILI